MLEHLLDFQPEVISSTEAPPPVEKTTPVQALDGKINTTDWLKAMGAPDTEAVVSELEKTQARASHGSAKMAVLAALDLKEPRKVAMIARQAGKGYHHVASTLSTLKKEGLVERVGRGQWMRKAAQL